jgi:uncharacterized OB-fold protein
MNNPVKNWRDTKKLSSLLGRTGKLVVWTKISVAPTGFEYQTPYFVGIVAFADGQRMSLQLVDCAEQDLRPNAKVVTVVRRAKKPEANDVIDYWVKAKLVA